MVIDMLNNTNRIYDSGQPGAFLRSKGLAGLGDITGVDSSGNPIAAASSGLDASTISSITTGINTELGYLTNLIRANQGLPPLPTSVTAPTVNVGLSSDTMTALAVAGVALIAIFSKRRKK